MKSLFILSLVACCSAFLAPWAGRFFRTEILETAVLASEFLTICWLVMVVAGIQIQKTWAVAVDCLSLGRLLALRALGHGEHMRP
jgi:hypothetical protein